MSEDSEAWRSQKSLNFLLLAIKRNEGNNLADLTPPAVGRKCTEIAMEPQLLGLGDLKIRVNYRYYNEKSYKSQYRYDDHLIILCYTACQIWQVCQKNKLFDFNYILKNYVFLFVSFSTLNPNLKSVFFGRLYCSFTVIVLKLGWLG